MLPIHPGLLALRDTGTARGEIREEMQEAVRAKPGRALKAAVRA